jgi:hypothetical protein
VALDRVEQPARRTATACLLGEVGVVAHLAVEVAELGPAGQVGLLDRAAALAGVEVAVTADGVAAGAKAPEAAAGAGASPGWRKRSGPEQMPQVTRLVAPR